MNSHELFKDVGLAIMGAGLFGLPAYVFRFPLLLGYLAAGVALGPHLGFGFIRDTESIAILSEIGLVLLMFILGLEIDLRKLLRAGKAVLLNGVLQFVGCLFAASLVFGVFGVAHSGIELAYIATAVSLSSTLVVVKILSDRLELDSMTSRITLGILVIQDLWAIAFLALQPALSQINVAVLPVSLGKIAFLIAAAGGFAQYVLPRIFAQIGKQPELMLVTAMSWCFGSCTLASYLGLSLEMGALVAGISIASFPYHADIASKVSSLRDFFLTLFFVALGLQIPKPEPHVLVIALGITLFALMSRGIIVFPIMNRLRYGNRAGLVTSVNLSQVSEFSLVITSLGVTCGHVRPEIMSAFIIALVVTALISSQTIPNSHQIYRFMNPWLERFGFKDTVHDTEVDSDDKDESELAPKVVLLGFYREASSFLQEYSSRHSPDKLKEFFVVDFDPEANRKLRNLGIACRYGDLSHFDTLRTLPLGTSQLVICTIPDHLFKGTSNLKLLRSLKTLAPQAKIIVSAETLATAREMYREGAAYVFLPRIASAHYLTEVVEMIQSGRGDQIQRGSQAFLSKWNEILP